MSNSTTPERINHDLTSNKITRAEANLLYISLIENCEDVHYRIKCLEEFGKIIINSKKNFQILENYLISDVNPLVRFISAKILLQRFPNLCLNPLIWVIENDNSIVVLKELMALIKVSEEKNSKLLSERLLDRFTEIYGTIPKEAEFLLDIEYELNRNLEVAFLKPMVKNKTIIALDFAGKKLKRLPGSIGNLSNLEYLNLWDNNLTTLPKTIESLNNLQFLYLDWNKFRNMPNLQWDKLKSLKKLSYTNNSQISEFPNSLFKLIKKNFIQKYINEGVLSDDAPILGLLEILTGMKLKKLIKKEKISSLYACNYKINLNGNISGIYLYGYHSFQINVIPNCISSLKFLEELVLRDQNINSIPEFIKDINTLKLLDLRRNNIEIIPESLLEIKSLEFLDLGENKIKELPKSVKVSHIDLWF
ncbi:MAG: leucine-rich repeat domain-containing protein [Candidatus Hodarchaeota archaeon]